MADLMSPYTLSIITSISIIALVINCAILQWQITRLRREVNGE